MSEQEKNITKRPVRDLLGTCFNSICVYGPAVVIAYISYRLINTNVHPAAPFIGFLIAFFAWKVAASFEREHRRIEEIESRRQQDEQP